MLPDWTTRIAAFTIYTGMNAGEQDFEISRLWLRAMGARAVHVPYETSPEVYKPFSNPHKFDSKLPILWREGGDVLYGVSEHSSLAHVVPTGAIVRKRPANGLDVGALTTYVAALDDPVRPEPRMRWLSRHSLEIQAKAYAGESISLQVSYHPGWKAKINGLEAKPRKDGLNFPYFDEPCQGACKVELSYDGGTELVYTSVVSALTALALTSVSIYTGVRWLSARNSSTS